MNPVPNTTLFFDIQHGRKESHITGYTAAGSTFRRICPNQVLLLFLLRCKLVKCLLFTNILVYIQCLVVYEFSRYTWYVRSI